MKKKNDQYYFSIPETYISCLGKIIETLGDNDECSIQLSKVIK